MIHGVLEVVPSTVTAIVEGRARWVCAPAAMRMAHHYEPGDILGIGIIDEEDAGVVAFARVVEIAQVWHSGKEAFSRPPWVEIVPTDDPLFVTDLVYHPVDGEPVSIVDQARFSLWEEMGTAVHLGPLKEES